MFETIWSVLLLSLCIGLCTFLCLVWLDFKDDIMKKVLNFKEERVQVGVCSIEYVPERVIGVIRGRFGIRQEISPEEYNVYYLYGTSDNKCVINNKELYENVKKGMMSFDVIVHRGYNRKGKLKYVYHTIA